MRTIILTVLTAWGLTAFAQNQTIEGEIIDKDAISLPSATVALLNPTDSTLLHFGISNMQGVFEIAKVPAGEYLMQVAYMGYQTFYQTLKVPLTDGGNLGSIVLKPVSFDLDAVAVVAERIPIQIKQDTVEFNAAAFKTKPDAVAEDLLKKLPGVEVDRAGNIKAMGENVNRVLVDGKEFFSNDPKVATKNLPAESINTVQVYDKKSDEAELLGIDDSEYDKTINFVLKDDMKQAIFGDVKGGGDANNYYQGNAKVYRFTDKHQFALLGMLNNVNRVGFSFQDYLAFNGGLRNLMGSGGKITLTADESIPVDFGQPVNGNITSGAGGVNYSYEFAKNNRFNVSYMGNGTAKELFETSNSRNFTSSSSFEQNSTSNGNNKNLNHLFNIGWRNKASKKTHFMLNGLVTLLGNSSKSNSNTESYTNGNFINSLNNLTNSKSNQLNSSVEGSWLLKGNERWRMLKVNASARYNQTIRESEWSNLTNFVSTPLPLSESQYNNNSNSGLNMSMGVTSLAKIGNNLYLEPSVNFGLNNQRLVREQGNNVAPIGIIDTLSPTINSYYNWAKPKLMLKKFSKKQKFNFGVEVEMANNYNTLNGAPNVEMNVLEFLPEAYWEYEYKTGRRIAAGYQTSTGMPQISNLQPIISTENPLAVYFGNRNLKHEYRHNLFASWFLFDQFSFTSLFVNMDGGYTQNSIGSSIEIGDDLLQKIKFINVPTEYNASVGFDFSTPIRMLGIKISLGGRERWNGATSFVNNQENSNNNLRHTLRLKFDNRRKEKWDIEVGGEVNLSDSRYSIQSQLNRKYFSYTSFGEVRYTPSKSWHFRVTADITSYNAQGFGETITVPLLGAEVSYYFMANKRAMLTLEGSDLLNRNTGVSRTGELNYLREVRSNTIGRFIMLSFKYKLNRFGGDSGGGITVETRR